MQEAFGVQVVDELADVAEPSRTALLVYDMQVGIAGRLPGAAPVIEAATRVLAAARDSGMRVFFCRHMSLPTRVAGAAQLRSGKALQRVASYADVQATFLRDSPGFPIVPELEPTADEAVLDKLGLSAFAGSALEFALRDADVRAFAVVGAVLELGIDPTVRHGADLGFLPVVVDDACWSFSAESRAATLASLGRVGLVTTVDEWTRTLAAAPVRRAS